MKSRKQMMDGRSESHICIRKKDGSAFDLLEIQFPDGEIRGFLKAETAFTLIQRIREKEHEKKEAENGK